eukprot:s3399_g1.t1
MCDNVVCERVVCENVVVCVREDTREEEEEEEEEAGGAKQKTRTPHNVVGNYKLKQRPDLAEQYAQCKSQHEKRKFFYDAYCLDPNVSERTVQKVDTERTSQIEDLIDDWFTAEEVAEHKGIKQGTANYEQKCAAAACVKGLPERDHEDSNLAEMGVKQYKYVASKKKRQVVRDQALMLKEEVQEVEQQDFVAMRNALKSGTEQKMITSSKNKGVENPGQEVAPESQEAQVKVVEKKLKSSNAIALKQLKALKARMETEKANFLAEHRLFQKKAQEDEAEEQTEKPWRSPKRFNPSSRDGARNCACLGKRAANLRQEIQALHTEYDVEYRLATLTPEVLSQGKKGTGKPCQKGPAARIRHLVPLLPTLTAKYMTGGSDHDKACHKQSRFLAASYAVGEMPKCGQKVAALHMALEREALRHNADTLELRIAPKLHQYLHLTERPYPIQDFWHYADETAGGLLAKLYKRRSRREPGTHCAMTLERWQQATTFPSVSRVG